jgi:DNA-binding NarL/FixJ family response regulator
LDPVESTITTWVSSIRPKMGANDTTQAVTFGLKLGIIAL